MGKDWLTVKELIEELQGLDQDSKVFMNSWYKKESGEFGSNAIPIVKGIKEFIDMDTNKTIYSIETQCIDVKAILSDFMKGVDYE